MGSTRRRARAPIGNVTALGALTAVGALAAAAGTARAEDLQIVADDGTAWSELVTRIQDDPGAEGRVYHVEVMVGGEAARCEDYTLSLDAVAAQAFRLEGCDATTHATALRVVDRAALFDLGEVVPRARRVVVSATLLVHAEAAGGGGPPRQSADVACAVEIMPTLWDALHGVRVSLGPDRYDVEVVDGDGSIAIAEQGDGWQARGEAHAELTFRYQVVQRATRKVVLASTATLSCADTPDPARAGGDADADAGAGLTPPPTSTPTSATATADVPGMIHFDWTLMPLTDLTWISRSTTSITDMDGTPVSQRLGVKRLDYYGTSLSWGMSVGWFSYQMSYTLAWGDQGMAGAWMFAMGATKHLGPVVVTVAPAIRLTMLSVDGIIGPDVEVDPALLARARVKISDGGWELAAATAAPLRDSTEWMTTVGFDHAWGM